MTVNSHGSASASHDDIPHLLDACERLCLSAWETGFIASLRRQRKKPSDKQIAFLKRIAQGAPNYAMINIAAVRVLPDLVARWLPGGFIVGHEYVVRNPKRHDRAAGSFSVNLSTGRWSDFAIGVGGGDPISLAAYLHDLHQSEAARRLAGMLLINGRRL